MPALRRPARRFDGGSAIVQANFIETDESGGSREFIGYWELVHVDGAWLLDFPHY